MTLEQATHQLVTFRDQLARLGFDDETIAEAIQLGGDSIPVFGQQLTGHYRRADGLRECHFAVPGWYRIEAIDGNTVRLRKDMPNADPFFCGASHIRFVLGANLEYVAKGLQP